MNEFLLVFRIDRDTMNKMPNRTPEEMQANARRWMEWIDGIDAQNKLVNKGTRLMPAGKVVKSDNMITDGPYTEIKECIVGYTLVRAASSEEAAGLAIGCPILKVGGNVEVRELSVI